MIRSPVFDRMLKSGMKETHDRTVEIEDANMETVTTMVYYMYTGKVRMFCDRRRLLEHWETNIKYEELLVLANKYEVLELVNHCGAEVAKALTKENALEYGIFGEMHNSDVLVEIAARYIRIHMIKDLLKDEDKLLKLQKSSPKLMAEVMKSILHLEKLSTKRHRDKDTYSFFSKFV